MQIDRQAFKVCVFTQSKRSKKYKEEEEKKQQNEFDPRALHFCVCGIPNWFYLVAMNVLYAIFFPLLFPFLIYAIAIGLSLFIDRLHLQQRQSKQYAMVGSCERAGLLARMHYSLKCTLLFLKHSFGGICMLLCRSTSASVWAVFEK